MNLKNGKVFTSKFVGTGPSTYEKEIYRAAVSQSLRNTEINNRFNYVKKISTFTGPRYPECSRKLRFPDYVKMAQDVGKVVSVRHRPPLPPENTPGTHFC